MDQASMDQISGFHAHVYFDERTYPQAGKLCAQAGEMFPLTVGRLHKKPIGPHPCGSCQLAFKPEVFGQVIPWLVLNRNGLSVLVHAQTGHDLKDHTEYVMWLGEPKALNLSLFTAS